MPATPPVLVTYRIVTRGDGPRQGVLCVPCAVACGFTVTTLDASATERDPPA